MFKKFLYKHEILFSAVCYLRQVLVACGLYSFHTQKACFGKSVIRLLLLLPALLYAVGKLLSERHRASSQNARDAQTAFEHELAVVAIFKNEAPYLQEWIEYHCIQGVTKFVLYDNDSSDNPVSILNPYIESGLVELISWPGKIMQVKAYTDAIYRLRSSSRWVAFIDLDEFIVPTDSDKTIAEIIGGTIAQHPDAGGLAIGWWMFGSSHHERKPMGGVLENYLYRADADYMKNIKTIGNPRLMHSFGTPHYPYYHGGACNINENGREVRTSFDFAKSTKRIHINHYFTKSKEECMAKIAKGIATVGTPRREAIFYERDRNEIYDDSMLPYVQRIKQNSASSKC